MGRRFSFFIIGIVFFVTLIVVAIFKYETTSRLVDDKFNFVIDRGEAKLDAQIELIEGKFALIEEFSTILAQDIQALEKYNEKKIYSNFQKHLLSTLGIFQFRILDLSGKELIRYDISKDKTMKKASHLQDKSDRYYIKESKNIPLNKTYFSKVDLNMENGKIEVPHRQTIRTVNRIDFNGKSYYCVVNYDITTLFKQVFNKVLYELELVKNDEESNLKLDKRFITQKPINGVDYSLAIFVKEEQVELMDKEKKAAIIKTLQVSFSISLIISIILWYVLERNLARLNRKAIEIVRSNQYNKDGEFKEFELILNNIYKQSQLAEKNKSLTRTILDSQSNFTIFTDGKDIKDANIAMLEFFGFSSLQNFKNENDCICDFFIVREGYLQKEVDGKTWIEVMLEKPDEVYNAVINDLDMNEHIFQIKLNHLIQDDKFYVVTFTDISEIVALKTGLEKKVDTQVNQIREKDKQLLQQSKLAIMGEMLSMIAHQWRQPLNAISLTASNLLLKMNMGGKLEKKVFLEELGMIDQYSQHLSSTIDDFRGFFKDDKKKDHVSVEELIDGTLKIMQKSLTKTDISITTKYESHQKFYTYQNEVKQVLLNIIKNAIDALLINEVINPQIRIKTIFNKKTNEIFLVISDNAGGIKESVINKIFEPDVSTKHEIDGTGLGLYMSKIIIEQHCEGSLSAQNVDGGAEFLIKFKVNTS
jgi:signal transduction histidine kinase